jgi:hypothetical protein
MFDSLSSIILCAAMFAVPDRPAPNVPKTPDLDEAMWYDQLLRAGTLAIDVKDGQIVFSTEEIKDRKLVSATIKQFDDKQQCICIEWAKQAELRFHGTKRLLLLDLRNSHRFRSDGSVGYLENTIRQFELRDAK